MMEITKLEDRIRAMFALGAIGDALGAPVEMMTAEAIRARYGRLTSFVERVDHKFGPIKKGETTDDTQLKLAIARSIANQAGINLGDIALEHVAELRRTTRGWGGSTTQAVKRLAEGVHWSLSGALPDDAHKKRGKGNGVAMKIDPLGAYCALRGLHPAMSREMRTTISTIASMTHASAMGVASGLAQATAIKFLLDDNPELPFAFESSIEAAALIGEKEYPLGLSEQEDRLSRRFQMLGWVSVHHTDEHIRSHFGDGSCYVYESLPLAYALFLRKPNSIEALYDAVNFGGDTDTVASIVGSLLGAYNGMAIVPQELWLGVDRREEIEEVVARFIRVIAP